LNLTKNNFILTTLAHQVKPIVQKCKTEKLSAADPRDAGFLFTGLKPREHNCRLSARYFNIKNDHY